ncbi:hypothetical protein [uncultured Tateyamaria sp.]|uniref:hypothetical protein n=1 Tax=uncultured Tateyamaria sp. TaxID=455651 RepID=UPI00260490CD|nr:hypothetical protein [uncultured Tateyamaria sp.]
MHIYIRPFTFAAALFATLAVTAPPATAQDFEVIKTEDAFRSLIVGKRLTIGDDHFVIRRNGSLRGSFGGAALRGAWEWRDGYWCRTLTSHAKNTDCQLWEVAGSQVRVTRNFGKGRSFIYSK